MLSRKSFLVLFRIIVLFLWKPGVLGRVKYLSSSKICGLRQMGLWIEFKGGCTFIGSPSYVLANKLKALKEDLKIWNREVFGDFRSKKKCLMGEIVILDEKEGFGGLSPAEHLHRDELKSEMAKLAQLEESSWRQKSQVL
jgi:hypothetical protein